jgi:hypothetical protein
MFGLFGKKKANEKHEQELKKRLANKLVNYESANSNKLSEFVNVNFDEFGKIITSFTLVEFSIDPWMEWTKENPSEVSAFNKLYKI